MDLFEGLIGKDNYRTYFRASSWQPQISPDVNVVIDDEGPDIPPSSIGELIKI